MPWNIIMIFAWIGFFIGYRRAMSEAKKRDEEETAEYSNGL